MDLAILHLLLASMEVIVWRMEMRAAVVEPRGRNANWSTIVCKYGGQRREDRYTDEQLSAQGFCIKRVRQKLV